MPLSAPPSQTTPPTPPQRSDPANFAVRGDGFLAWIVTWFNELLLLIPWIRDAAAICESAAQAVNVSEWISGTTYAVGDNRFDPVTLLTYRRKTAGAGTTRPGLDGTNWQLLTGFGDVDLTSTQTLTNKTHGAGSVWAGGAIPIANGGTGATSAAAAFTAIKQAASTTATGVVELATDAEAQTGTDTARAVTPDNLGATVLGIGQAWQNVSGSRANNTTYTNTTGRTIVVSVSASVTAAGDGTLTIGGVQVGRAAWSSGSQAQQLAGVVPPGATYNVNFTTGSIGVWSELI
jgi:hypothetical protein